jgi:hypothetical protein
MTSKDYIDKDHNVQERNRKAKADLRAALRQAFFFIDENQVHTALTTLAKEIRKIRQDLNKK